MTAKEAIRELEQIKQYCTARSIPAVDYAIKVLQQTMEESKEQ